MKIDVLNSLDEYEQWLAPARERFAASSGIRAIQASSDEAFLESFLLHFCALGTRMTEPVERWIRRAAERCASMGLTELARALKGHALAEAGHHRMMIADVKLLAARWNARRKPSVDVQELLDRAPTPGVLHYARVHEENIDGDSPYAQIAIEYEIEMIPLRYGNLLVARCVEILGTEILSCLSFVRQHIELDAAHTRFNARSIAKLVELSPSRMAPLVSAGTAALDAYAQFIDDCVQLAKRDSRKARGPTDARPSSLSWQLQLPLAETTHRESSPLPSWLVHVRSLRGSVLFDNGSRPQFIARDGRFFDADPIDLYSYHILAYDGTRLVGCVRIYRLVPNGPTCVSERIFGEKRFTAMLHELGVARTETVEIGRWVVHPAYRATSRSSGQLAAASAAVAMKLRHGVLAERGIVVCSVGTRDRQDSMLARIGLAPVPAMEPIDCDDFNDKVRMMYCSNTQQLHPRFLRMMDEMAKTLGLAHALSETQPEPF
jgi:Acetyltransferase (GNAT) domain